MAQDEAVILLVEDNKMDVELTLDAFRAVRLRSPVHVVTTGEQALDYLLGRPPYDDRQAHPLPDLILLDLKLPGLSGQDVLAEVKRRPGLRRIPVVVLTSSREEGDRALSYDLGANSYLVKPLQFREFMEVIRTVGNYWITLNVKPPKGGE
ncbi:MAG: response regulator [Candidatus Dadabacteria bacterium]|nr:MAG: response regulator [Candidatus Dadabacteria bacterium]